VTQYGMTERLGAIKLGSGEAEPFLGRDFGHQRDYSEDIAAIVDEEVSKLISNAHQEAFDILTENRDVLDDLVRALFERETLDRQEVAEVFGPLRHWPKRPAWTGSDRRVPSKLPPVTPPPPLVPASNGHHALNGNNGSGHNGSGNGHHPGGTALPPGGAQIPPGHFPASPQPPAGQHPAPGGAPVPGQPAPGQQSAPLDPNRPETWPPPPPGSYSGGAAPGQPGTGSPAEGNPGDAVQPPRGPDFR